MSDEMITVNADHVRTVLITLFENVEDCSDDEVDAMRAVGEALGLDPMSVTPYEDRASYEHPHVWNETEKWVNNFPTTVVIVRECAVCRTVHPDDRSRLIPTPRRSVRLLGGPYDQAVVSIESSLRDLVLPYVGPTENAIHRYHSRPDGTGPSPGMTVDDDGYVVFDHADVDDAQPTHGLHRSISTGDLAISFIAYPIPKAD